MASPADWLTALFGSAPTMAGAAVSAETALTVPAVGAAIRTISEAVATLDIATVIVDGAGIATPTEHPALRLIRGRANDWTSGFELLRDLTVDALCRDAGGLAWVNRIGGQPKEIIRYRPGVIGVDRDTETGEPSYTINAVPQRISDIIHVRAPFDLAPLTLARETIGIAMAMQKHAANLFGRGAKPGGLLKTKKSLGDDGVKRMLVGWKTAMEGADNAGRTAVLWDDVTWEQMTLNSVDAQFHELWLFVIQEIARAFNMPAPMLGDLSRATWANGEQKGREFLSYCLEPWLRMVEGALGRALFTVEEIAQGWAFRFDRDDLTRADLTARATAIASLRSSLTINSNEGRSWLGLAPRAGGESFENPNTGASQPGTTQATSRSPSENANAVS